MRRGIPGCETRRQERKEGVQERVWSTFEAYLWGRSIDGALSGREAIQFKSSTAVLSVTAALCFLSCGFTSKAGYTHRVEGVLTHDVLWMQGFSFDILDRAKIVHNSLIAICTNAKWTDFTDSQIPHPLFRNQRIIPWAISHIPLQSCNKFLKVINLLKHQWTWPWYFHISK